MLNKRTELKLEFNQGSPKDYAYGVSKKCLGSNEKTISPTHMILPLDSGNGRTQLVKDIAKIYSHVVDFSSRDRYLEFAPNGTIRSIDLVDIELQEASEYANDYHGLVALDLDDVISSLSEAVGQRLFELIAKIKKNTVLLLFLPANCPQKQIAILKEKIGANSKAFDPIHYSVSELAAIFYAALPAWLAPNASFDAVKDSIGNHITANNFKTIKAVREAAKALVFDEQTYVKLFDSFNKQPNLAARG